MAGINVNVKPEIITWILRTIQLENIAASAVDLLYKWQTGEKTPTFNQIEEMSRKINIPFGYFFLDQPPTEKCSIVEYRTVDSAVVAEPSRNLIDTVDLMTDIQEWMAEYAVENGQERLDYVGCAAGLTDMQAVVQDIRKKLNITVDWYADRTNAGDAFRFLKGRIEDIRVLVMMSGIVGNNTRRKLNIDEFRAFTLTDAYAPLIFINSCDSETGKLFSIIHELVHIWVGKNNFYNVQTCIESTEHGVEKFCNSVAAEILVPAELFVEKWETGTDENLDKIEKVSKDFRCSRFVVARKALDTGKISRKTYGQIVTELNRRFKEWQNKQKGTRNSGGDYYRTLASKIDKNVVKALASSAAEGKIQYTEVYRLTNTNRKTFKKLSEKIGV